jgi:1-pyrroline-5-carboxylate dehydrogenase
VVPEFRNEPLTDFSVDANANAFRAALAKVQKRLPLQGKNRIGGKAVSAAKHFTSLNPCDFKQVIGRFPEGTTADAGKAIAAATSVPGVERDERRGARGRRAADRRDPAPPQARDSPR